MTKAMSNKRIEPPRERHILSLMQGGSLGKKANGDRASWAKKKARIAPGLDHPKIAG
jgi:hypothetical protein